MEQTTSHSPKSHTTNNSSPASTTVTTPDQSPGADDDIWDTSSDHDHDQPAGLLLHPQHGGGGEGVGELTVPVGRREILSDLPQLRRQHMTDGYREGLAVGKASVMQDGFDAGYPFGVEIGLRVGVVLGVLEGVVEGLRKASRTTTTTTTTAATASANNTTTTTTTATSKKNVASVEGGSSNGGGGRTTDTRRTNDDDGIDACKGKGKAAVAVPDIKFVEQLYEQAKRQLKVSELLKGLDDEMVDRMGRANLDPGTGTNGERPGSNETSSSLPTAIEETIARWEDMVLGSLAARSATAQAESTERTS
ncbi:Essential protein Yae1, N terminal [Exophiala xenobiotica]|nr:Essential protein Yae1, N terminal [Exophiala xenobiotica]KAK5286671.1 Essential protein Yae1, N terminal [Exophiala xenobiotica]KAK5499896.1 Essential protein Yae1, N terminal [Exophiala xenobiotica]